MDSATAASLLGVPLDASRADIERAFRHRARLQHPDVTGDSSGFAAVTEARDVLIRAEGWRAAAAHPAQAQGPPAPARRLVFELPPPVLVLLFALLILGCFVAGTASRSPLAPVEPVLLSVLLVGAVAGYALTHRRVFAVLTAIAVVAMAVATVAWVSFGTLLGGALMTPAVLLLVLHGRNRPL